MLTTLNTTPVIARAIDLINEHLVGRVLPPVSGEMLGAINDPDRHTEACWMLDDLRARVRVPFVVIEPLRRALVARFGDALYVREFPDYGPLDFALPAGFVDTSWHNDACPSFQGDGYRLFADYKMPEHREHTQERFVLVLGDDSKHAGDLAVAGESVEREITPFVEATRNCAPTHRVRLGRLITRAKAEIVHDVLEGFLPLSMRSYADLRLRGDVRAIATTSEPATAALLQATIHNWLACGAMRTAIEQLPRTRK